MHVKLGFQKQLQSSDLSLKTAAVGFYGQMPLQSPQELQYAVKSNSKNG